VTGQCCAAIAILGHYIPVYVYICTLSVFVLLILR